MISIFSFHCCYTMSRFGKVNYNVNRSHRTTVLASAKLSLNLFSIYIIKYSYFHTEQRSMISAQPQCLLD